MLRYPNSKTGATKSKMFSKKAQVFTWDVVLATILFMVVLWMFIYLWAGAMEDLTNSEIEYELNWLSTAVSEQLVRNAGVPHNWTKDPQPEKITIFGLADTETIGEVNRTLDRVLDPDKVIDFINLTKTSYLPIRNKLFGSGRYDYYVEFYCLDAYSLDCFENLHLETIERGNVTCQNGRVFYIQNFSVWTDPQLAGLWHLDETSGNVAHDGSGNDHNGNVYGALKAEFLTSASPNSYSYISLTDVGDYTIQPDDKLEYDLYWTLPGDKIAVDYTLEDGTSLRNFFPAVKDQNGLLAKPDEDLTSKALNTWYHRIIDISSVHNTKTIKNYDIACENNEAGIRTAYFDNIVITNGGSVRKTIFQGGAVAGTLHLQNHTSLSYLGNYASPLSWNSPGKFNGALDLDGVDDYVEIPSTEKLNLGVNQTISAWVNVAGFGSGSARLVGKGNAANRNFGLWLNSDGSILYQVRGESGPCDFPDNTVKIPADGNWYNVLATYNGSDGTIYVNGAFASSRSCITVPYNNTDPVTIGYAGYDGHVSGLIDEVKLWNRTLLLDEITEELAHTKKTCLIGRNTSVSGGMDDVAHDEKTVTFNRQINSTILDENATLLEPTGILKFVIYRTAELPSTTTTT